MVLAVYVTATPATSSVIPYPKLSPTIPSNFFIVEPDEPGQCFLVAGGYADQHLTHQGSHAYAARLAAPAFTTAATLAGRAMGWPSRSMYESW